MELKCTIESDTPADRIVEMYEKLLDYAQSFERNEYIQERMTTAAWRYRNGTYETQLTQNILLPLNMYQRASINPFKTVIPHPVEHGLQLAKYASDENDLEKFQGQ